MGTLSLRANLALAIASAGALVLALGMPWYGPAPVADEARIENLFETMRGVFTGTGVDAHAAMSGVSTVLTGLAALIVIAAALCLVPALEEAGRSLMQLGAMAAVGLIVVKLFDQPGLNVGVDLRYGIFAALAAAGLAFACAGAVAAKPKLRKPPPRMVDLHRA